MKAAVGERLTVGDKYSSLVYRIERMKSGVEQVSRALLSLGIIVR